MKRFRRMISGLMALCMVLSMVPVQAWAEEPVTETAAVEATEAATQPTEGTSAPTETVEEPAGSTETEAVEETTAPTETEAVEETTAATEETVPEGTVVTAAQEAADSASGTCGDNAIWTYDGAGVLTISGSGSTHNAPWLNDYQYSITSIIVEEGITHINEESFQLCSKLTSVSLPDTLQSIGANCFLGCNKLESITLPHGLLTLGAGVFSACTSLKEITIPASVKKISPRRVFFGCTSMEAIHVEADNSYYCDVDGVLYSIDRKTLVAYPAGRSGAYTIERTVEELLGHTFYACRGLTAVTIPNGITEIPEGFFMNCSALTDVSLPDSLTEIEKEAFSNCDSLTAIDIPESVSKIGFYAFGNCYNLESIEIPEGVTVLNDTFRECSNLSQVILPSTLRELKGWVFYNCRALKALYLPEGITNICYGAFDGTGLEEITLPETVTDIEYWSFSNSDSLERVVFGANVQSIGSYAFYCKALNTIVFTGNAPTIASDAFPSVTATVYYPENNATWTADVMQDYGGNLTWVAGEAPPMNKNLQWSFEEGSGTLTISVLEPGPMDDYVMSTVPWKKHREEVKSVVIQEGVTSIGSMAFCNFPELSSVSIPATVTEIGSNAFAYCSQLTSVEIPSGVAEIGDKAFYNCWRLSELTFSEGLEQIGDEAFDGCKGLTSLALPEGLLVIGVNAFADCEGLTTVHIPASVTHIEDGAFGNCKALQAFTVAENGVGYSAVDGILYDKDQTTLILAPTAISGICNVPETVRYIRNKAFWRCLNLKELVFSDHITTIEPYAFYESTLSVCYPRGYASWNGMQEDYGGTVTWVPIGLLDATGTLSYVSSGNGRKGNLSYHYMDEWFYGDCTEWESELARMSMRLSLAAAQTESDDIEALYSELEFDNTTVWYPQPTPDTEGYIIGSKHVRAWGDDESIMIVAVTVRGGGYGAELEQNFELGYADEHSGYRYTADKLVSEIRKHIEATGTTENIKLWITGFGRGGSVTNIAAHRLNTYADEGKIPGLSRESIYAYCFGNANVVKISSSGYKAGDDNIFNLTNPNDYTSYLAPANWDYARYGTDYYLPTSMHMFTEYGTAYAKMQLNLAGMLIDAGNINVEYDEEKGRFKWNFGWFMPEIPLQGELLKIISNDLAWLLLDEYAYTRDNQEDIMAGIRHVTSEMNYAPAGFVLNLFFELLPKGPITDVVKTVRDVAGEAMDCFTHAHWPELWVAWMDAIEDDTLLQLSLNTRFVSVNCPVDLEVYDSSGNLVARFVNDVPQEIAGSTIRAYLDSNGQKIVVLPTDEEFRIVTTATGDGTVSYQVQEYDIAAGTITRVIDYLDIPIQIGDTLNCAAGTGISAEYTVEDQQGNAVEPDRELRENEIVYYDLSVSAEGNGTVTGGGTAVANSFVKIKASAGEDSLFAGWYCGEELISGDTEYRFRMEEDTALTAKFVSLEDCGIEMQTYIALQKGASEQLTVQIFPEILKEDIVWRAEEEGVVQVDPETGTITALEVGTAYVIASVDQGGVTLTARCRVDVAEMDAQEPEKIDIQGIQLSTDKLSSELYSTDYAELDILLILPQNDPAAQGVLAASSAAAMTQAEVKDNGVAIEKAEFTDEATAELFDISILDDRRVQIVPTAYAVEHPKEVAGKYTSAITVTVQGEEYTSEALTLTVKKTTPKLKAAVPAFNSFYTGQSQTISVTGGTVTDIREDDTKAVAIPTWLTLENGVLTLAKDAPLKSISGKAYVLVETEEWRIPVALTLSVKNTYKVPGLKLSSATATFGLPTAESEGVELKLLPKDKGATLQSLKVVGITAESDGCSIRDFDPADGSFRLTAEEGFRAGKIRIKVFFGNTDQSAALSVTLKTAPVKLKLDRSQITLNTKAGDSAVLYLEAVPGDRSLTAPELRLTDASGEETKALDVQYTPGRIMLKVNSETRPGETYKLQVSQDGSTAVATVKTVEKDPAVTLKAKGNLDLSFPKQTVTVTSVFKNYSGGYSITNVTAVDAKKNPVTGFTAEQENGTIAVSCTPETAPGSYTLTLELKLDNGMPCTGTVKVTVKRTAVKLKLSATKLTLNKLTGDTGTVAVSCTTKGYVFDLSEAVLTYDETKLNVERIGGNLTVSLKDAAEYGKTYPVSISAAYQGAPAVKLNVAVLKQNAVVKSTIKATGTLDVIRSGTAIIVKPTYTNVLNVDVDQDAVLKIYTSEDKYGTVFATVSAENGIFTINDSVITDHSLKYRAQLETRIAGTTVVSNVISLSVKMGTAKLTLEAAEDSLFAKDSRDRLNFCISAADGTLNEIAEVTVKDAKYQEQFKVLSYGSGRFALCFRDGKVDSSLIGKTVTLTLNVRLEGNETAKANASLKLKLRIVP